MADNAEEQQPEQPHDETVKPNATNEESPSKRATEGDLSYNATPRPGGYIRIGGKQRRFDSESKITEPICTCGVQDCREKFMTSRGTGTGDLPTSKMKSFNLRPYSFTRMHRIESSTRTHDWLKLFGREERLFGQEKEDRSGMHMLITLISTVMILATDRDPGRDVLYVTRQYLQCIKDENGNHPPNVQGLLNQIALMTGEEEGRKSVNVTDEEYE